MSGSSPARCATPKSASFATPGGRARRVGDDHVLRLDVAVHDAAAVRVLERAAQREADPQHVAVREHALGAELVERAAVDQLGDQVARPRRPRRRRRSRRPRDGRAGPAASASRRAALGIAAAAPDGITLTATGALQALVGGGVDRAEAAGAEPVAEPVAAEDELGSDLRRELVRGLHQACGSAQCARFPPTAAVILEMAGRP